MKVIVSDYIANFLVQQGIDHLFTVVGGGSMFLNDSFGHQEGLTVTYHHHEQAAAMAAEGYARTKNQPSAVCVTTGPGGTNALTGCLCAYTGSIPVLFFSGQVRYETSIPGTGLDLRIMGIQEYQIVESVKPMTKFAETIIEPSWIRYYLEKALFIATHGRPGPVWLDIPLDVQGATVETDDLQGFQQEELASTLPEPVPDEVIDLVYEKLCTAERPVILAGKGLRLSGGLDLFYKLVHELKIPVVTGMSSVDALPSDDVVFAGRAGMTGDRAGNLAMQNSDVLLSIGNRLSYSQIGFNYQQWARGAYKIAVDIDSDELMKPILKLDLPVVADAREFVSRLHQKFQEEEPQNLDHSTWLKQCKAWKDKYPVVTADHFSESDRVNIYAFYKTLSDHLKGNDTIVVSAGTARVVGAQAFELKQGQRFISNSSTASMGYDLPASIGACLARENSPVICVTGDGSLQMNIQELQTIKHNNFPIKIFVINNEGYHSIRITQDAYFPEKDRVGIGEASGDLSFPDLSKVAAAYGYPYYACKKNEHLEEVISACLTEAGHLICEVVVSTDQRVEPKAASRKLANGRFVSAPLEDMAPFLPREDLKQNMCIPLVDEQ